MREIMQLFRPGALLLSLHFAAPAVYCQVLTGLSTRWDDSFREWVVQSADGEGQSELRMRWQMQNDWTQWDYRLGERTGQIRQKWPDNPNEWEVRGDNQILLARTVFHNDFRQWRLSDGARTLTIQSRYGNSAEEWETRDADAGSFVMYTAWEGDPRDWVIVDELEADIDLPWKMALAFLVMFHSTPKQ